MNAFTGTDGPSMIDRAGVGFWSLSGMAREMAAPNRDTDTTLSSLFCQLAWNRDVAQRRTLDSCLGLQSETLFKLFDGSCRRSRHEMSLRLCATSLFMPAGKRVKSQRQLYFTAFSPDCDLDCATFTQCQLKSNSSTGTCSCIIGKAMSVHMQSRHHAAAA